jgi:hypothetical protein
MSTLIIAAGPLRAAVCRPSFPIEHNKPFGWQGADAAYSIPLNDGRTVWIFGDTLYGPERVVKNNEPRMVRNSLGVSTCDSKGNWNLEYIIRNKNGQPQYTFGLADPAEHLEYLANDGTWKHGFDPTQAKEVMKTGTSELSVRYHPELKK